MGRARARRWVTRLVVLCAVGAVVAAVRERKLAENARRYGLPT